jgi:hypothetical protein
MTQRELERAVANATGESLAEIQHRGFQTLFVKPPEPEDMIVDWDELQLQRNVALVEQPYCPAFA